ncbi:MAG: GNAT family N-acetyltransferase [Bacteroidales bacterium]|nr:GNAT family N-acetyltransferase [Bacteroidales bacterium]
MIVKEIIFGSIEYNKSIDLRDEILRKPLGLAFTSEFLQQDKDQFHIAAFEGDKIVGILILKPLDKNTLKMRQVAVNVNLQGKGIGRKMVEFSEKFAVEKGFSYFELNARKEAIPFYEKLNYLIVGDEFFEVGISHKKMVKKISN